MQSSSHRAPNGDQFAIALEACRRFLLAVASAEMPGTLTPKGGASDLVQETLAKAHAARDRFHGRTLGDLRAWLRGILANEIAMFRRHYRAACRHTGREVPVEAGANRAAAGPAPVELVIRAERFAALAAAVADLPADTGRVVRLRMDERLTFLEIAARLGRTEDAVRKSFARALDHLRGTAPDPAA
jgi:RNA polymerase sigma-70 factor (ECF subfamily)